MSDRVPCLNPRCGRTFKRQHEEEETICGKCWRLLPPSVRHRDRQLRRRWKLVERLEAKGTGHRRRGRKFGKPNIGAPQSYTMALKMQQIWRRHWNRVRNFYLAPEKPVGLEAFFEEVGL